AAQIGDVDADLDGERAGQRLADRDRLAHLFLGEPAFVGDELALHLADQRHRPAEAEEAEAEEIEDELRDGAAWGQGGGCGHAFLPGTCLLGTFEDHVRHGPPPGSTRGPADADSFPPQLRPAPYQTARHAALRA